MLLIIAGKITLQHLILQGYITNRFLEKYPIYMIVTKKSSLYSGYVFVFKSDNSVVATKEAVSVTGQWETR